MSQGQKYNPISLPEGMLPAGIFDSDGNVNESVVRDFVDRIPSDQLGGLVKAFGERERRRTEEKGRYYVPTKQQLEAHKSDSKGKLVYGGNRSGKTEFGVQEIRYRCIGKHPFRTLKHHAPIRTRIIADGWGYGVAAIMQKFREVIPREEMAGGSWDTALQSARGKEEEMVFTWANGSTVQFMSYEQDVQKMAGVPLHYVWFDEPIPHRKIFEENFNRLIDYDGDWCLTMTPATGKTWIYPELYLTSVDNGGTDMNTRCFQFLTRNNVKHLSEKAIQATEERYAHDPQTLRMRLEGEFIDFGGLVFPMLRDHIHLVDDFEIPLRWPVATGTDPGLSKSHATGWAAFDPDDKVYYVFKELMLAQAVPASEWVKMVSLINGRHPLEYALFDPKWNWENKMFGNRNVFADFQAHWPTLMLGESNREGIYYTRLRSLAEVEPISGKSRIKFFRNSARKTYSQFKNLAFKSDDGTRQKMSDDRQVVRVDNDLVDCHGLIVTSPFDRYLFDEGSKRLGSSSQTAVAEPIYCPHTGRILGYKQNFSGLQPDR